MSNKPTPIQTGATGRSERGNPAARPYTTMVPALAGLTAGLYLSRVLAESAAGVWRLLWLIPLMLVCGLVGVGLTLWLSRRRLTTWPLFALGVYILWPGTSSAAAGAVALGTTVMLAWVNHLRWPKRLPLEVVVFAGAMVLYVSTLAPGLLPADSGEFQLVCQVLGIAHPPGYPLYTLLGKLFTLIPLHDPAWRVNLFGAVCGALTLAVVARSVRRVTGSHAAGALAAGMLGLGTTFWAQSTTANIRSLTALFAALSLAALLRWQQAGRGEEAGAGVSSQGRGDFPASSPLLMAFALCFGLGVGHHASLGLLGLGYLAFILACEPRLLLAPKRWLPALGVFVATFAVLLYLPLRSRMNPAFDPAPIRTWSDFTSHVLASGFGGDMFYFRTWPELVARIGVWLNILRLQFGDGLLLAALLAIIPLARRNGRALLLLLATLLINTLAAVTYRAPQTTEYLIPSYVAWAMLLGCGLGMATSPNVAALSIARSTSDAGPAVWKPRLRSALAAPLAALTLAVVALGLRNYPSFQQLHHNQSTRDYATAILQDAPQGALVLSNWHQATGLWYLQTVEHLRPDVEVVYVYPEGATPNEQVWLRRIAENVAQRPVVVTNWFYAYEGSAYRWIPFHGAWLVRQEPLAEMPDQAVQREAVFQEGIRLLGYELQADALAPGDTVDLRVYWQPTRALERDYSSFAQLVGPQGVVGQGDIMQASRSYLPGEVRVDAYRLPLLLHTPPGEYQLITGFYYTIADGWQRLQAEGQDYVSLTTLRVQAADRPAATLHTRSDDYANGLRLTGVDYDQSVPGQMRLYLHWQNPRRLSLAVAPWVAAEPAIVIAQAWAGENVVAQASVPALARGEAATVALDVPDETRQVDLRLVGVDGATIARLEAWHRPTQAAVSLSWQSVSEDVTPQHYIPLGGEMAFVGWSRLPKAISASQDLWLRPRFLALRPLVNDETVSVGLRQDATGWEQKADGTPALGAIPTLKWVKGWLIEDAHRLTLAADAPAGESALTLQVYDAFSLHPLGVLDERLVKVGQGTTLELEPLYSAP